MAIEWEYERTVDASIDALSCALDVDSALRVRRTETSDAPALYEIYRDAFSTRTDAPLEAADWISKWPMHPLCIQDLSAIALWKERPVGYVLCYLDDDEPPREGLIGQVGVRVEQRCMGLGSQLVLTALRGFARHGLKKAMLRVAPDNVNAIRLYEALGFRRRS